MKKDNSMSSEEFYYHMTATLNSRVKLADCIRISMDRYTEAGFPFGNTVDAMMMWVEFNTRVTSS